MFAECDFDKLAMEFSVKKENSSHGENNVCWGAGGISMMLSSLDTKKFLEKTSKAKGYKYVAIMIVNRSY